VKIRTVSFRFLLKVLVYISVADLELKTSPYLEKLQKEMPPGVFVSINSSLMLHMENATLKYRTVFSTSLLDCSFYPVLLNKLFKVTIIVLGGNIAVFVINDLSVDMIHLFF